MDYSLLTLVPGLSKIESDQVLTVSSYLTTCAAAVHVHGTSVPCLAYWRGSPGLSLPLLASLPSVLSVEPDWVPLQPKYSAG